MEHDEDNIIRTIREIEQDLDEQDARAYDEDEHDDFIFKEESHSMRRPPNSEDWKRLMEWWKKHNKRA